MSNEQEKKELIVLKEDTYILDEYVARDIALFEMKMKEIKLFYDEHKKAIKEEMAKKNIKSIKDEVSGVSITYIEPTEREKFDTKKFREDHAELYDDYVSFTAVSDSIRVSVSTK